MIESSAHPAGERPAPAPEVLYLPTSWVLEHYRPTEGATWAEVRADFAANHTHLDALADDIGRHGVLTPLQLHPAGRVLRGHHRLLTADELGTPVVPVMFAHLDEDTRWDPELRDDVPDDGWDTAEEAWQDRVFPVPDAARQVAVPHCPAS